MTTRTAPMDRVTMRLEDAASAVDAALAELRETRFIDAEQDASEVIIPAIQLLIRQLRVGSVFAPTTPTEFVERLERILVEAEAGA